MSYSCLTLLLPYQDESEESEGTTGKRNRSTLYKGAVKNVRIAMDISMKGTVPKRKKNMYDRLVDWCKETGVTTVDAIHAQMEVRLLFRVILTVDCWLECYESNLE